MTLALTLAAGGASAKDFQPAIIFDMGGKFDKSFNEAAYNGAEKFKKETGIAYLEFEVTNERPARAGAAPHGRSAAPTSVVAVGFAFGHRRSRQVAKEFPEDQVRDHRHGGRPAERAVGGLQGARGLVPRRHGGAPWRRKTGKVGFVGGMDIPLIRKFACGYEQGVKDVDPKAKVFAEL